MFIFRLPMRVFQDTTNPFQLLQNKKQNTKYVFVLYNISSSSEIHSDSYLSSP